MQAPQGPPVQNYLAIEPVDEFSNFIILKITIQQKCQN